MTVYGAPWCPHCKRVKKFLAAHRVRYAFVDIDTDPQAIDRLKELQDGGQIIPTVIYPDGRQGRVWRRTVDSFFPASLW